MEDTSSLQRGATPPAILDSESRGRSRQAPRPVSKVGHQSESDSLDPIASTRTVRIRIHLPRAKFRELVLRFLGECIWERPKGLTTDDQLLAYQLWSILSEPPSEERRLSFKDSILIEALELVLTLTGREASTDANRGRSLSLDRLSLTQYGRLLLRTLSKDAHHARSFWTTSKWTEFGTESVFTKRAKGTSTPYDDYCKGYGNGGKPKLPHEIHPSWQVLDRKSYAASARMFYTGPAPKLIAEGNVEYW
jgi:hypothetical protein